MSNLHCEQKENGIKFYLNGQLHNPSGPAIITNDGNEEWWYEGYLHRVDGPAIIRKENKPKKNIRKFWYLNGKNIELAVLRLIVMKEKNGGLMMSYTEKMARLLLILIYLY